MFNMITGILNVNSFIQYTIKQTKGGYNGF